MHRSQRAGGSEASKPCRHFFATGRCSYGARCKFSHDSNNNPSPPTAGHPSARPRREPEQPEQDSLRQWKRLLRQHGSRRDTCDQFFQLALQLMDGDVGASQETIKLLAGEQGLAYIRELVNRHIQLPTDLETKTGLWRRSVRPLFQLLTHSRVVDSLVLEQEVATIYSIMRGTGSSRMRILFDFVLSLLESWAVLSASAVEGDSGLSVPALSLTILAKMIDTNTTNIIDDNFKDVVERFGVFLDTWDATDDDFSKLQAQQSLRYLRLRLGVGDSIANSQRPTQTPISQAEFVIRKDLPGRLSSHGPRHDNDHANIADISILPTREEIISSRGEYLPPNDPSQFHLPGIRGRLDREFRLLREDTVGQLRDSVRGLLETLRIRTTGTQQAQRTKNSLRTYIYEDVLVHDISMTRHNGMDLLVQFRQPDQMHGKDLSRRIDWWEHSKRLQPGGLVCVISNTGDTGSILFFVVADGTIVVDTKPRLNSDADEDETAKRQPSLAEDREHAYVHLQLADTRRQNMVQALRWYRNIGHYQPRYFVEFPGVLLPSFQHTLMALQRMSQKPDVPFIDLIAPTQPSAHATEIPSPRYSLKPGFVFDLSSLSNDGTTLQSSPRQPLQPEELANHSTLDVTQSTALLDTLNRSLALTQGPPGTGKSFTGEKVIKTLLANKAKADLGPILCVCYTNHALDQLLVHLLHDGGKQIIRIGTRSKSEELKNLNLRNVAKQAERTKKEKHALYTLGTALDIHTGSVTKLLNHLESSQSPKALEGYLRDEYPDAYRAIFGPDGEDGWTTVRRYDSIQLLEQWRHGGAHGGSNRDLRELEGMGVDPWQMTHAERARLHTSWLHSLRDSIIDDIVTDYAEYESKREERARVSRDVDLRCLHEADIIGVTTTGLARNLDLLQKARCKVMLCEEAGEVLEAHTLTALLPSVEHAILIGDHLQLRPQIQNYDLSSANPRGAQYSLDVSLFERLVNPPHESDPRLPYNTLETQRRMHPSISNLIRSTLYPQLEDGGPVAEYPEVLGMKKRLFWLQHEVPEDSAAQMEPTTTSHTNSFEIEMTVALVQHLVRQGSYAPDDIAVITPYLGQLFRLRRRMQTLFEISVGDQDLEELDVLEANESNGVGTGTEKVPVKKTTLLKSIRLATVDNFQGEEAKVVLMSLVRSNDQNRCGFLNTPNRINVLLSRARHGMYLIGNSKTYGHVPMWAKVIELLQKDRNLGPQLELQCARHPDAPMFVSQPDHFLQFSPEGGCMLQCDRRLACGHSCVNRCHSEVLHNAVKCLEPCPRPKRGCDHPCRLTCGDKCEPRCNERLAGTELRLPCGHKTTAPLCWEAQNPSSILCKQMVQRTIPGCNHTVEVACHHDVKSASYQCRAICGKPQPCGHACKSRCHQCNSRQDGAIVNENHGICKQPCFRNYTTCRHQCTTLCHGETKCQPCGAPCEIRCCHSKCSKLCHEPCAPCAEQSCASHCEHTQCTMPCAAPCDWVPCSLRCKNQLSCGHQCPSICGEVCPDAKYCQTCGSDNIKKTMVDFIIASEYQDVDLNEDPCLFPDCGHFLTKSNMDGIMDMKAHYVMTYDDNPTVICKPSLPFSMKEVKVCPSCRGSLRSIARYGRIVRRAMLDEATKKFISWSNEESLKLANNLLDVQQALSEAPRQHQQDMPRDTRPKKILSTGRVRQLHLIRDSEGLGRYTQALRLWTRITRFIGQVKKEEQPFQRVADFVQHAARLRQDQETRGKFAFDESRIQYNAQLQAEALLLRCELLITSDFMELRKDLSRISRPETQLDFTHNIKACTDLIALAEKTKHPRQQAEGHVYFAQFSALARALIPEEDQHQSVVDSTAAFTLSPESKRRALKAEAETHLDKARAIINKFQSTQSLLPEIETAETMLRDSVFYTKVFPEEMRAVYEAMRAEFSGTGHWYTCANGHPFTVGECGMPMERASCPQCGAPVGGAHHTPAEGVRRASAIEELGRRAGG